MVLALTVLAVVAIGTAIGFSQRSADSVTEEKIVGTWESVTRDAPGQLIMMEGGKVEARGLTLLDPYSRDEATPLATNLTGEGSWVLVAPIVDIDLLGGDQTSVPLLAISSPLGGVTLQAVIGDPDSPTFTQVFHKVE
ncbi:hypothetical protein [Microbacterium sp. P02]|uniref:hypothetical protein n=1 Tax=Microbacterium sp. P02 TaxID=3366260 RepID=UPI00366E9176